MTETIDVIKAHRSIRKYKPDPVPDEVLNEVLEAGIRASSAGNMNVYSIIVTRGQALREQLYSAHMEQCMVLEAPVMLTFCADFHRMRKWLDLSDAPQNFDNFMGFLEGTIDAVLVSQNVALAAEARGLGICFLGSTLVNCDMVGRILQLPEHVVPVVGFSLGYPAEDPPLRDRLPLDGVVHKETYQDYSDDRVREVYRERETAGWDRYMANEKWRERVVGYELENLAQLYTRVKYTRESYQEITHRLFGYLEEQGFMENYGRES
jgi:nitroreductase